MIFFALQHISLKQGNLFHSVVCPEPDQPGFPEEFYASQWSSAPDPEIFEADSFICTANDFISLSVITARGFESRFQPYPITSHKLESLSKILFLFTSTGVTGNQCSAFDEVGYVIKRN